MNLKTKDGLRVIGKDADFFFKGKSKGLRDSYLEEEKWSNFVAGKKSDFEFFYERYNPHLFNYGLHICTDRELVKDCIQDTFITLIKNKKSIKKVSSIKFYLFKCFKRKLIKSQKKQRNLAFLEGDNHQRDFLLNVSNHFNEIEETISPNVKKQIKETINALPSSQRESIILYFYEGMTYKEIATLMNMTRIKSARALIYRALTSISQKLNSL